MRTSAAGRATQGQPQAVGGTICPTEVYRLDEVKRRAGWGDVAFRAAVRKGLRVHKCGKRTYVVGSDLVQFITTSNSDEVANG